MNAGLRRWHKYGAKATVVDGIKFPSQAEAKRYGELRLLEKAGEIRNLTLQPGFVLMAPVMEDDRVVRVRPIGSYRADFKYEQRAGTVWRLVVEDVKGMQTETFRWKKKHVEAQYGIEIVEIRRRA